MNQREKKQNFFFFSFLLPHTTSKPGAAERNKITKIYIEIFLINLKPDLIFFHLFFSLLFHNKSEEKEKKKGHVIYEKIRKNGSDFDFTIKFTRF